MIRRILCFFGIHDFDPAPQHTLLAQLNGMRRFHLHWCKRYDCGGHRIRSKRDCGICR